MSAVQLAVELRFSCGYAVQCAAVLSAPLYEGAENRRPAPPHRMTPRRGGFRLPTVAKDTEPPDPHQCKPGKRRPISLAAALCARVRARAPHRGAIRAAGPFQRTPCRQPSCLT